MNIFTVIPIYRNKFQKSRLYFSQENFPIGSIILVPYSKLENPKNKKEKPALIIEKDELENKKQFLRKNNFQIDKIINPYNFILLLSNIIKEIKLKSIKIEKPVNFSLEKLFTKRIKKELNIIIEKSDKTLIKKYAQKINSDFISSKLKPFLIKKSKTEINPKKVRGVQKIGDILINNNIKKSSLHSEKHYLIAEIREYFNETAKKGKGSFSFYLGFFKRIPEKIIYLYWAEVKESRKSIKDQQKIFWWKIGKYLKENKKQK